MPTADGRLIALNPDNGAVCRGFGGGTRPDRPVGQHAQRQAGRLLLDLAAGRHAEAGHRRRHGARQLSRPRSSPASSAPSTSTPARWSGTGTPAIPTPTAPLAAGPDLHAELAQQLVGLQRRRGARHGLCPARQPAARPVGRPPQRQRSSASRPRSSRSTSPPARCAGCSRRVHHDLWDYDVPAQPALIDLDDQAAPTVPALVQPTKQGELLRARPPHRRADPAGHGSAGAARRRAAATRPRRRSRSRRSRSRPPPLTGSGHVGRDAVRPARLPHRLPPLALRGPLHAAFDARAR